MTLRCAAFNTGSDFHLLDHIAPLASLMNMPLITTEEQNFTLASRYYPQIETRFIPDLEFQLGKIASEFDVLFECKYWAPHLRALFKQFFQKEMHLVFCPHGQSDKGFKAPLLVPYAQQEMVLIYGKLLMEMLLTLNIWPFINRHALVGNYRRLFYEEHRLFYDAVLEKEIFSRCDRKKRTLLYAPTWRDADEATSFFKYGSKVISELPSSWNLILKVHPLLEQRDPAHFYAILAQIDAKPNALLVSDFPLIYPLLAKIDVFLGDFSSVGYDFLHLERPMFFLPTEEPSRLYSCGQIVDLTEHLYSFVESRLKGDFRAEQKKLYSQAFDETISQSRARENILRSLNALVEERKAFAGD